MYENTHVLGGRLDPPHYPTFQIPFIVGNHVLAPSGLMSEMTYVVPFTGELFAISIDSESYQNDDNWDLFVEGEIICERVYVKRAPEGVNFMAFIPVFPGQVITVKFRNEGQEKSIWCSLHFLKLGMIEPPPTPPVLPPIDPPVDPPGTLPPITVQAAAIRLYLWDTQVIDGDLVNIYLNGALINEKFYLHGPEPMPGKPGRNYIEVPLQMGQNLFVFEGVSAGHSGYLSGKMTVGDVTGNVIFDSTSLPSLEMDRVDVIEPSGDYINLPQVHWMVTRKP